MSRQSRTKQMVLRGVFEDNAGIPRSFRGKGRSGTEDRPQPTGQGRQRVAVLLLLAVLALFGYSFRLVTVNSNGPAAMQLTGNPSLQFLPLPPDLLAGAGEAGSGNEPPAGAGPNHLPRDAPVTSGAYDAMLASMGIPVADLFNLRVRTIVIDPGHGGIDPGARGPHGLKEKDVVMDIAKRLRDKLARSGKYHVLLTHEKDRKMFLKERVAFAREHHADLFISIHINSLPAGAPDYDYVETYYFGPDTDQRSLELAQRENRDSDYFIGDFRKVIARIGDTLKTEESKQLARSIHEHLYRNLHRHNPGLLDASFKTGPFVVLLGVEVPSVLVEVSCISNAAEEARLARPGYRDNIADYLMTGIVDYLEQRTNRRPSANRRPRERGNAQHVAEQ
jgi:N-acetylmuramoyl-L-alanine amidase